MRITKSLLGKVWILVLCGIVLTFFTGTAFSAAKPAASKASAAKAPMEKKSVKKPAASKEVMAVQKALNENGFKLKEDGLKGPKTRAALKAYQKKSGLKVTGKADKETLAKLGI